MAEGGDDKPPLEEGKVYALGEERWQDFPPKADVVLEFEGRGSEEEDGTLVWCALLCTELRESPAGDVMAIGRFLGSENECSRKLYAGLINRRNQGVHFCRSSPCDLGDEETLSGVAAHSRRGRFWAPEKYEGTFLQPWGKLVLKEYIDKGEVRPRRRREESPEARGKDRKDPGKKRKKPVPRLSGRGDPLKPKDAKKEKKKKRPERAGEKDLGQVGALREKLRRLRARMSGEQAPPAQEVVDVGSSEESGSDQDPFTSALVRSALSTGDYEVGGFKRWYYEQEEAEEKEEQCFGSEAYQQPAAGSCRAAGGFKEGGSQEKEKQKRWHLKGKGGGAPVEREGEEDQEGRRSLRGWKFFRGGKQESRIFVGVRAAGAFVEEKPEKSGQGASSSGGARSAGVGSVSPGRDGRVHGGHWRSEDGHVLQPADQAVSSYDVPRHEGVASLGDLSGRAEKRETGCSGRQPGFPVLGDSLGGERRRLESGAVPGAPSTGANSECTHLLALAGKEACSRGGEESGDRQLQPLVSVGRSGVAEGGLQRKRKRKREEGQRLERKRLERPKLQLVARRRRMVRQAKLVGERKGKERREERGCEESRQMRSRGEKGKSYKGSEEAPHMMRGFEGLEEGCRGCANFEGCRLCLGLDAGSLPGIRDGAGQMEWYSEVVFRE